MHNEIFLLPSIFDSYIYKMKGCFCIFTKDLKRNDDKIMCVRISLQEFNFRRGIEQDVQTMIFYPFICFSFLSSCLLIKCIESIFVFDKIMLDYCWYSD